MHVAILGSEAYARVLACLLHVSTAYSSQSSLTSLANETWAMHRTLKTQAQSMLVAKSSLKSVQTRDDATATRCKISMSASLSWRQSAKHTPAGCRRERHTNPAIRVSMQGRTYKWGWPMAELAQATARAAHTHTHVEAATGSPPRMVFRQLADATQHQKGACKTLARRCGRGARHTVDKRCGAMDAGN